jgi:hypothetical protein
MCPTLLSSGCSPGVSDQSISGLNTVVGGVAKLAAISPRGALPTTTPVRIESEIDGCLDSLIETVLDSNDF